MKFEYREHLVNEIYSSYPNLVQHMLAQEEVTITDHEKIVHWLNKVIWANNMSVREGKHLRLSIEGRHFFNILSDQKVISKVVQPFDPELSNDHGLWLELSRKCPVPWFVYPSRVKKQTQGKSSGARVELWEFGPDSSMLSFMLATADVKKWVNLLN